MLRTAQPLGPERPFDVTGPLRALRAASAMPPGDADGLAHGLGAVLSAWWARRQQRRQLLRLDDRLLRDIGVTRDDVRREAGKPFWRP